MTSATTVEMLASAVAGQGLTVRPSAERAVYTDGEAMFVPSEADDVLVAVCVQSALLAAGSLDTRIAARLLGRTTATRRYLTLEAARAVDAGGPFLPRGMVSVVTAHWSGEVPGSADESLDRALSREVVPEAPAGFGSIRPRLLVRNAVGAGTALTDADVRGDTRLTPMPELPDDDKDTEDVPKFLQLISSGTKLQNPFFRMMRSVFGAGTQPSPDQDGGGEELPVGGVRAVDQGGPNARLTLVRPGISSATATVPAGGFAYPEWDGERSVYRPDWCHVGEFAPASATPDSRFLPSPDHLLRRKLARLALVQERWGRQPDGEAIDLDALVEFAVSRRTGEIGDDNVYEARRPTARDLGVIVLLDASGSTAEHDRKGTAIWDEQRRLAAKLITGLEEVGDRVAAYGFNSRGRHHVRLLRIKRFDDRFDQTSASRLTGLAPAGFTRLGAAVRHAAHIVSTQAGTNHRLLIVVSDGFPYEDDYQYAYAELDTRQALAEAQALGVGCACVSVASATDEAALERLWGNVPHARFQSADSLGEIIEPLLRAALRSAARGHTASPPGRRTAGSSMFAAAKYRPRSEEGRDGHR